MRYVTRTHLLLPITLLAAVLLAGCGFMREHFGRKDPAYQLAPEVRPLEIPPDLHAPNDSSALSIPAVGTAPARAPAATAAQTVVAAPPAASGTAASAPVAPGVTIADGNLRVADTPENTWRRVGLAIERSGVANITTRDEEGRAYAVLTTGSAPAADGSWLTRALSFGRSSKGGVANVPLTVRVSADGNASRVSIEGATDEASRKAARAVLAALRKRLS